MAAEDPEKGKNARHRIGREDWPTGDGDPFPVCEPQDSWRPSRSRWSVSIDERRRLAVLGGGDKPGLAGANPSCRDLARIVAQLVSDDVDKDVLFPHPPRSSESTNAFQAILVRSNPFWHHVTLEAPASRSPPS